MLTTLQLDRAEVGLQAGLGVVGKASKTHGSKIEVLESSHDRVLRPCGLISSGLVIWARPQVSGICRTERGELADVRGCVRYSEPSRNAISSQSPMRDSDL
jgi:hypothetical protein